MSVTRRPRLPSSKRYEFHEPIGEGGAGTVFRATDLVTKQPVAIKVLATKLSENETMHRRLAVEFQAAQALEHPNIVRAIECQCDGTTSFLVYELVEGESLGVRLDRLKRLPEAESIGVITQLIQALHYAARAEDHSPRREARQHHDFGDRPRQAHRFRVSQGF